ncbi:MAG: ketoacyl-ACP synthase III [bacterium]|nr:ketoacyl-ACP synthase III [bacterium]
MKGKICGTGSYVPEHRMDNDEIAAFVDTNDEWIRERTGVEARHIAGETETTVFMACMAGRRALADAGIAAEEIDLLIVSTTSSNLILPCTACEVQKELKADQATCFDLSAACTGFLLAYHTALAYLNSGIYHTALLIGSECLSNLMDWKDRGTCILFGDGAGAVVLKGTDGKMNLPVTHSDGAKGDALTCKSRHDWSNLHEETGAAQMQDSAHRIGMDGQAVFRFAVKKVPEVIEEVLARNHLTKEDVTLYVLHQANKRIVEAVAKRLDEPIEKFPMNIQEYGNTSSASIPILLDELHRNGRLHEGDKLVLAGFGAGLTWGAAVVEW